MRALLVLTLVLLTLLTAATALAYAPVEVGSLVASPKWVGEPAALLLSGSALLALAGALRRLMW